MKLYKAGEYCGKSDRSCTSLLEQILLSFSPMNPEPSNPRTDHISYDNAVRANPLVVSTYLDEDAASQMACMKLRWKL